MSGLLLAPSNTARLNASIAASPPHLHPVLVAVRDCGVGLLFAGQGSGRFALPDDRPAVVMIGDDMEKSVGPSGFHLPSVRRAIRQCAAFAVVSAQPSLDVYAGLTSVAVGGGRAMIVETRIEHEFAWIDLIRKLAPGRPLIVLTVEGGHA